MLVFALSIFSAHSQCWKNNGQNIEYKINTIYNLDSLIVSEQLTGVLNHSISLLDSFEVERSNTWLYYVICLNSIYKLDSNSVRLKIELQQGVDYDIFYDRLYEEGNEFSGAFCYNGYTFFVLSDLQTQALYNQLFISHKKMNFYVYYKNPAISKKLDKLGIANIIDYIYLFYTYKNGTFHYHSTSYLNE